jgi:PAS domain S-box-containing protein
VVDDEPEVASVTATFLERRLDDAVVVVESSASDGLARLERGDDPAIDCIVSDYEMPEVDGLEFLRRIRDCDHELPFILFTARGSEEIASEAISAGVTDYLQKRTGTDQYTVLANRIENAIARRESEAAVAETETRYERLLESSPHAVGVHDGEEILFANERLGELVGYEDAADLEGVEPLSIAHEGDRPALSERKAAVIDGEEAPEWMQWRLQRVDGEVRYVESRAAPVRFEGKSASQFVLQDVTDRRRHERRIRALHDATRRLVGAEAPTEVGRVTMETVEDVFNEALVCLWAFDPAAGELVVVSATESARALAREDGLDPDHVSLPDWTIEMEAFESGDPRAVEDYRGRPNAVTDALEVVLMYPLDGHGLLTIGSTDPERTFDASEQDLVGILARSVAAAMDRVGADTGKD